MLQDYLEGLVKEANVKAEESAISVLPFDELAKLAGVKIGMSKCSGCGADMEKSGSMFKCSGCGMHKSASPEGQTKQASAPVEKVATEFEKLAAPVQATMVLLDHFDSDLYKTAEALLEAGLDEDTAAALIKEAWAPLQALKGGLSAAKGIMTGAATPVAAGRLGGAVAKGAPLSLTQRAGHAARAAGGGVAEAGRMAAKDVSGGLQAAKGAIMKPVKDLKGHLDAGSSLGKSIQYTAASNPLAAMGATGALGVAGGYGASKLGSANGSELLEVGDAAGRLLAKMAQGEPMIGGVPLEELRESIEEAKGREDPAARSRAWQIGGGTAGGMGGAALGLGGTLLARRLGLGAGKGFLGAGKALPAMAAGSLGTAGALVGQQLGKEHGREEGEADLLLQKLRARQAYGAGGRAGYEAGGMAGFRAGLARALGGNPPQGR